MKKRIIIIIFTLLAFLNCKNKTEVIDHSFIRNEFNQVKNNEIPIYLKNRFPNNWYDRNIKNIVKDSPSFKINNFDSLEYLIVPSLNIPINIFEDYKGNFLSYLSKGKIELNNSKLLIFENDSLLLKFTLKDGNGINNKRDGLYSSEYSSYLRETNFKLFEQSELYYKISITDGTAIFPIPGIVFEKNNDMKIISSDGRIYPIEELHKLSWKTSEDFD
jgi:hypothetical protein